jgi:hypothetical protein
MASFKINGSVVVTPSDADCEVQIMNDVHTFVLGFHTSSEPPRVVTEFSGPGLRNNVSSSVELLPSEITVPTGEAPSSRTLDGVYYQVRGGGLRLPDGTWLKG